MTIELTRPTHTPGPWRIVRKHKVASIQTPDMAQIIASVGISSQETRQIRDEANARLIAKAPEMLPLIEWVVWQYEREQRDGTIGGIDHAIGQSARRLLRAIAGEE